MSDEMKLNPASDPPSRRPWLDYLDEEDRAFLKRFVLASGSLKELGRVYGISYPTVRLRLDRLIAKIQVVEDQSLTGEFERLLRAAAADGRVDRETMRTLLQIR